MKHKQKPNDGGWHVPKIWLEDEPVFIFGGGPSIKGNDFSGLSKYHSIAVNTSWKLGPEWIDVCFFGDFGWWSELGGREDTRNVFKGQIISCNPAKVFEIIPRVKQIRRGKPVGIDTKTNYIAWNYNTGFAAINLAYHYGARTIVLIGFDMRLDNREKNWHSDYVPKEDKMKQKDHRKYINMTNDKFRRYLACVPVIAKDADALGVTILNATPNSAIQRWPIVNWKDYL